ncbi:MAG: M20/M25/M40 family metallo-hydrolase, partial [Candidatus Marinimicrobia bacterium]|nr:M20/M25/M40 family metallo-hydrolase [Candidatus Neomarinimicrobiota bacterium]
MNNEIRLIQPKSLWNNFTDLNSVPRPSKEEEKVIDFLIQFAKKLNLNYFQDNIGNLIIVKPSTEDMKDCKTIVLQSHVDMVHEKNNDVDFDFKNSGINMHIDGDWVKARGTTLGADNGLGVASIMAILQSDDISHPRIEALFTIDEETGMTGALNLDGDALKGEILLNLDTEEDDEICIGCAGGIDINISKTYIAEDIDPESTFVKVLVNGLTGGHSGAEIHKGLGNSNKILNSLLKDLDSKFEVRISEIKGGNL